MPGLERELLLLTATTRTLDRQRARKRNGSSIDRKREGGRETVFKTVLLAQHTTVFFPFALLFKHIKLPNLTGFTDSALHYTHIPNQTYIKWVFISSSQRMSTLNNFLQEKGFHIAREREREREHGLYPLNYRGGVN